MPQLRPKLSDILIQLEKFPDDSYASIGFDRGEFYVTQGATEPCVDFYVGTSRRKSAKKALDELEKKLVEGSKKSTKRVVEDENSGTD